MTGRRRQRIGWALALGALVSGGVAVAVDAPDNASDDVVELLGGISFSPTKRSIDEVLGEAAVEDLISIAQDQSVDSDPGLRLRAYRALGEYSDSEDRPLAMAALQDAIRDYTSFERGVEVLFLRASMSALADLDGQDSLQSLLPLLSHPSRDVRTGCVHALARTGNPDAIQPLRDRALVETVPQVAFAIDQALFALSDRP